MTTARIIPPSSLCSFFTLTSSWCSFLCLCISLQPSPNRETPKNMSEAIISVNTRNMQPPFTNSSDVARLLGGSALPELGQVKAYNKARRSSLEKINQVVTSAEPRCDCSPFHMRPRLSKLRTKTIAAH